MAGFTVLVTEFRVLVTEFRVSSGFGDRVQGLVPEFRVW
jgi:hypothetical protein